MGAGTFQVPQNSRASTIDKQSSNLNPLALRQSSSAKVERAHRERMLFIGGGAERALVFRARAGAALFLTALHFHNHNLMLNYKATCIKRLKRNFANSAAH